MERIRPLFRLSLPGNVMVKVSFQLILHIETSETTDIKKTYLDDHIFPFHSLYI